MSSIDRLAAQTASRTYVQNTDAARSGVSSQATKAHENHTPHLSKSADSVSLSNSARSLAAAREAVTSAPDVRDQQRVSAIKQQVADGTYNIPAHVLARKMLQDSNN